MKQLIYCYDAYCTWCFAFSPVIRRLADSYKSLIDVEVLSGGMIIPERPTHVGVTARYIEESYRQVEKLAGVQFGSDYLWHIKNPEESDWFPDSRKPAIALAIFKDFFPELQVQFAGDLQNALFGEGRDLCDNEAYRNLLDKYGIDHKNFYQKLASPEYKEKAQYEFALVKQLQVKAFPALLFQESETRFHLVAKGFTDYETLNDRIKVLLGPE